MAELIVMIVVAALAIALGLWLFSNLGAVLAVVILVGVVGLVFAAIGALFESIRTLIRKPKRSLQAPIANAPAPPPAAQDVMDALDSALKAMRHAATSERRALSALPDSASTVLSEVEKRREFARKQGLDDISCWLLRETWHYRSWSQRADAAKWIKLPVINIADSEEKGAGSHRNIEFEFQGIRWRLEFSIGRSFAGDPPIGTLKIISDEGEDVLVLRVSQSDGSYDRWHAFSIDAFKPGPWVAALVALYEKVQIEEHRERIRAESGPDKIASLKNAFDI